MIDTWCENEVEQCIRIAKQQGRVKLIGRPTMGNVDYLNPITVRYNNYTFTYPISKTEEAKNGNGVNDNGIQPDIYVVYTVDHSIEDVLFERFVKANLK